MNKSVTMLKLPDVCSQDMNHYVSLSLTNRKSSVHLHALNSPRTALTRRDQLERDLGTVSTLQLSLNNGKRAPIRHKFVTDKNMLKQVNTFQTWDVSFHTRRKWRNFRNRIMNNVMTLYFTTLCNLTI
jgi:hypothetical protein